MTEEELKKQGNREATRAARSYDELTHKEVAFECYQDGFMAGARLAWEHQWVSVDEQLPPEERRVFVMLKNLTIRIDWMKDGEWHKFRPDLIRWWMYIPPFPKLGKQEKDADTVIQGWVCRDKEWDKVLFASDLYLSAEKPKRDEYCGAWTNMGAYIPLNTDLFPDLTWDDAPIEVEIIIKRKKK